MQYKEEGLIDVSGYIIGFVGAIGKNVVVRGVKFASELQGSIYVKRENKRYNNIPKRSMDNDLARDWYNAEIEKMKILKDRILTLEERARFCFNFRNQARTATRENMKDTKKVIELNTKKPNTSWEKLIEDIKQKKGLTKMEDIYQEIIESSQRTNPEVNSQYGSSKIIPKK
ncbi:hypothetical protein CQA53_10755 [Helicobacter didelphidarum]|uniref:Uncharacterized protein n=2 Tax=Helicobacter didelphidarum TaxID=2040648 RepID=A0A3D8I7X8_9HELI|nr:hypothetical protein CQA53_10755 [Helicobacter didelphidarum]